MQVVLVTTKGARIQHDDVESVLPATRTFPQWTIYTPVPEQPDDTRVIFYSADSISQVAMVGPREESSEEGSKEGTVISLVKDRGDESET